MNAYNVLTNYMKPIISFKTS